MDTFYYPHPPADRGAILAGLRGTERRSGPPSPMPQPGHAPRHLPMQAMSAGLAPSFQRFSGHDRQIQPPYSPVPQHANVAGLMAQLRFQNNANLELLAQRQAELNALMRQQAGQGYRSGGLPLSGQYPPQSTQNGYINEYAQDRRAENEQMPYGQQYPPQHYQLHSGAPCRMFSAMESALACKVVSTPHSSATPPPPRTPIDHFRGPSPSSGHGSHQHSPSVESSGSSVLSAHGILSSPSGPTVVLSRPDETFDPMQSAAIQAKHRKHDSDASSTGSGSESYDSLATTVSKGSQLADMSKSTVATTPLSSKLSPVLNPGAIAFSPMSPPTHAQQGANRNNNCNASGPIRQRTPLALPSRRAGVTSAVAIRQPRGAVATDEPEFASQNFASRIRQQGRNGLGVLVRRINSPGPALQSSLEQMEQQEIEQPEQQRLPMMLAPDYY